MCKGLCFGNNGKYQLQPTVNAGNVKFEIWEKESENIFSTNDVTSQVPEKTFCDDDVEMMTIFNGGLFWHVVFVSFSKLAELRETVWGGEEMYSQPELNLSPCPRYNYNKEKIIQRI